jgi:hypothetical protein
MKKLYTLAIIALSSMASYSQVVISQVYGGGGNTGATYKNDFVELFNRGNQAVTLTGHTLQYASGTGVFDAAHTQTLPTITLQPGQYFLIQEAAGAGGTMALPTPDFIPATEAQTLGLGGANGKIVLATNSTPVTSVNDENVVDFVGYGTATTFEGNAPVVPLTNTTAALRASNGCQDTDNNSNDFVASEPTPRNTSTAVNICGTAGVNKNTISGLKMFPNPLSGNTLNITSDNNADKMVAIYDVLGKQVLNAKVANGTVNVSGLTSGVYMVKVTEEGKTSTKKLVIR